MVVKENIFGDPVMEVFEVIINVMYILVFGKNPFVEILDSFSCSEVVSFPTSEIMRNNTRMSINRRAYNYI